MEEINLKFFGPYPFANEEADILENCEYRNRKGIYLWAVKLEGNIHRIAYVGETKRSFYVRTKEHLLNQLAGTYAIYDPILFAQGIDKIIWGGIWQKDKSKKLRELIKNYADLAPINLAYIKMIEIFVAPIEVEKNILIKIEGKIANELRTDKKTSVLLDKNIRYTYDSTKNENIRVIIDTPVNIKGMPTELSI